MATTTTNLGLTKPEYSDTADIADINGNMDILDTAVNATEAGLAIISNNNTHAAISQGQYVYVRNHGSLAEGLYKATTDIAANASLNSTKCASVSGGLGAGVAANTGAIAEINSSLNGMKMLSKTIPANDSITVVSSNNPSALAIAIGGSDAKNAWIIKQFGSGGATVQALSESSRVSAAANGTNFTFSSTASSSVPLFILCFSGDLS